MWKKLGIITELIAVVLAENREFFRWNTPGANLATDDIFRRQSTPPGYSPEFGSCGSGRTCEDACGPNWESCQASTSLSLFCYNRVDLNQTCCENGSGRPKPRRMRRPTRYFCYKLPNKFREHFLAHIRFAHIDKQDQNCQSRRDSLHKRFAMPRIYGHLMGHNNSDIYRKRHGDHGDSHSAGPRMSLFRILNQQSAPLHHVRTRDGDRAPHVIFDSSDTTCLQFHDVLDYCDSWCRSVGSPLAGLLTLLCSAG
ncbi:hypothetical protein P885DRAFT_63471 [Corynascus similis CBS 632.67]